MAFVSTLPLTVPKSVLNVEIFSSAPLKLPLIVSIFVVISAIPPVVMLSITAVKVLLLVELQI